MGVSVYALKRGLANADVPVGAETLRVTYRPGVITPAMNDARWFDPAGWLALTVESWDLEDDAGATVPLRKVKADAEGRPVEAEEASDALRGLPTDFLAYLQREINRDLLPGKRFRATSASG